MGRAALRVLQRVRPRWGGVFQHRKFPGGQGPDRRSACGLDLIRRGLIEIIPRADRALQGFFR